MGGPGIRITSTIRIRSVMRTNRNKPNKKQRIRRIRPGIRMVGIIAHRTRQNEELGLDSE